MPLHICRRPLGATMGASQIQRQGWDWTHAATLQTANRSNSSRWTRTIHKMLQERIPVSDTFSTSNRNHQRRLQTSGDKRLPSPALTRSVLLETPFKIPVDLHTIRQQQKACDDALASRSDKQNAFKYPPSGEVHGKMSPLQATDHSARNVRSRQTPRRKRRHCNAAAVSIALRVCCPRSYPPRTPLTGCSSEQVGSLPSSHGNHCETPNALEAAGGVSASSFSHSSRSHALSTCTSSTQALSHSRSHPPLLHKPSPVPHLIPWGPDKKASVKMSSCTNAHTKRSNDARTRHDIDDAERVRMHAIPQQRVVLLVFSPVGDLLPPLRPIHDRRHRHQGFRNSIAMRDREILRAWMTRTHHTPRSLD